MKQFLLLIILLGISSAALASPSKGAPAFLLLSFPLFTAGLLWSACIEGWIYQKHLKCSYGKAVWQALGVNLLSGLIIGIGLPFAVSFISGIGIYVGGSFGEWLTVLGSWVFQDSLYREWAMSMVIPWMAVSFWLTLKFELWFLKNRIFVGLETEIHLKSMNLYANIFSYSGLVIAALVLGFTYNG